MLRKNSIKLIYLPNNYRLVALLNIIGKIIKIIITQQFSSIAEEV